MRVRYVLPTRTVAEAVDEVVEELEVAVVEAEE